MYFRKGRRDPEGPSSIMAKPSAAGDTVKKAAVTPTKLALIVKYLQKETEK